MDLHPIFLSLNFSLSLKRKPTSLILALVTIPDLLPKTMAVCVHNSRTKPSTNPLSSLISNEPQNDNSLYKYVKYPYPNFSDLSSCCPINQNHKKLIHSLPGITKNTDYRDNLWLKVREESEFDVEKEPILSDYYFKSILSHSSLESSLANHLAMKLSNSNLPTTILLEIFLNVFKEDQDIGISIREDLKAVKERDPACISYVHCILNFKGFLACQAHRVAHKLWSQNRKILALLIQNRVSEVFGVDIHPGAKIGRGILFDHATGIVIGETAVVGNNVSILHNVTLGGTGKECGDRHPKIGDGVLIGACTSILGNVRIGEGAKIGAGSVVVKEVPARTTAVGNPARLLGGKQNPVKLDKIPSSTMDHTSNISEWYDYVV